MNNEWISVKTELPKRIEPLIGYNDDNVQEVMIENYQATVLGYAPDRGVFKARLNSWGWSDISKISSDGTVKITHWMPLPEPPKP